MNPSTEKMLMQEIPRIRELLDELADRGISPMSSRVQSEGWLEPKLKMGIIKTKNGRYMKDGKFIKKEEAYE